MPTFPRLGRHSNRSQHGLPEQLVPGPGSQQGASATASTSSVGLGQQSQSDNVSALSSSDSYQDAESLSQKPQPPAPSSSHRGSMLQKLHKAPPAAQYSQHPLPSQPQQPSQHRPSGSGPPPLLSPQIFHSTSNMSIESRPSPLGPGIPESQLNPGGAQLGGPRSSNELQFDGPPPSQAAQMNENTTGNYSETPIHQAVGRSQSQRYSTIQQHPYQQHLPPHHEQYLGHHASSSVDNLVDYQRTEPAVAALPEKKSNRKRFMKGIFSSNSSHKDRSSNQDQPQPQQQQQQQRQQPPQSQPHLLSQQPLHHQQQHLQLQNPISSPPSSTHPHPPLPPTPATAVGGPRSSYEYNNNNIDNKESSQANLLQRIDRNSVPPNLETDIPSQPPNPAWHQQHPGNISSSAYSPHTTGESPLVPGGVGEVDDYHFSGHESDRELPPQQSRTTLNKTIRQVAGDQDNSPHDEGSSLYRSGAQLHQRQPSGQQQLRESLQTTPQQQQQQPPRQGGAPPPSSSASQQQQQQQQQQQLPPHQQQPQVFLQTQDQQQQLRYDQPSSPHPFTPQSLQQQQPPQQLSFAGRKQGSFPSQTDEAWILTNQLAQQQHPNPETVSQLSYESPTLDDDQRSAAQASTLESPAIQHSLLQNSTHSPTSPGVAPPPRQNSFSQGQNPEEQAQLQQQQGMMPGPRGSSQNPRAQEVDKATRTQGGESPLPPPPPGAPAGYRQGNAPINPLGPPPPQVNTPVGGPPPPMYRDSRTPQFENGPPPPGDPGRASPGGSTQEGNGNGVEYEKVFKDLVVKYKNVKRLFYEGKDKIELLTNQVETLQNAVANQRMSQSRTAWDDNEYANKFNRLNGAIKDLSFNIRKDWKLVPTWLEPFVSADAIKTGKQEMTAVGRALISRWLVEELFNKCFHPGLDRSQSVQLKEIELSIRGNAYTMHSQEEYDALTMKIVNWRMATLDGLAKKLNATSAAEHRAAMTAEATNGLTAFLYQHLNDGHPSVEANTSMIVEVAVGIAANLPMESRDVAIMLPLPGDRVQQKLMDVEKTPLPGLGGPKEESDSDDSDDEEGEKTGNDAEKKDSNPGTVRFAGFIALEVRGRQVLLKAPVWTL